MSTPADDADESRDRPRIGLRPVIEGTFAPTAIDGPPDEPERAVILDQPGLAYTVVDGSLREEPFLDLRDRVVELYYGHDERGLLGIAFHPNYAENRRFFVRYSAPTREGTPEDWDHTEVLSEFRATEDGERAVVDSERVVLEIPHPGAHHNAGDLAFGPDGYLYLGMGDGGNTGDVGPGHVEGGNAQAIEENLLGSVLRIDVDSDPTEHPRTDDDAPDALAGDDAAPTPSGDGSAAPRVAGYAIPDDNPLVGEDGRDELYAWGFRNPYQLSVDSEGRVFAADVGEHLFEWINLVERGGNYGWNVTEGSHCFDPEKQWRPAADCPDESERGDPFLDPIVEYPHVEDAAEVGELLGSAIIGGHVYDGDAVPELDGAYVFGDMSKRYDAPRGRLFAAMPADGAAGGAGDSTDSGAGAGDTAVEWDLAPVEIEGMDSNLLDGYLFAIGERGDGTLYLAASETLNTREEPSGTVYEVVPPEDSEVSGPEYGWADAGSDAYWYSLYNMNNVFVMSGNGVVFPYEESQFESLAQEIKAVMKGLMQRGMFMMRSKKILKNSRKDDLPVENPHLNVAPFTTGDPTLLEDPDPPVRNRDHRPDADTMRWDRERSSQAVSPAAHGWTHLKGVTWAKSFEHEFDLAPIASRDRPQILGTAAQLGIKFAIENGHLLANPDGEEDMRLVGAYRPATDEVIDDDPWPEDYAAMLWFLADMVSFAENGWFGYREPSPMIEVEEIQTYADRMARTTFEEYPADAILDAGSTRDLGVMLGAAGWYGTHAGSDELVSRTADYANQLADAVEARVADDGRVEEGDQHQAATQGVVGQGLLWASQVDGVDREAAARPILEYLLEDCWDDDAGVFASDLGEDTYVVRPQDAGDVNGGLNAADELLGVEGVRAKFARNFDETFNRGRLMRATRWQAYRPEREPHLPLEWDAGGEHGQAAVYNAEVEYDVAADEWRVTNDAFHTEGALYLSNQDLWASTWAGSAYPGRGVPGQTDTLERWAAERERDHTPPSG